MARHLWQRLGVALRVALLLAGQAAVRVHAQDSEADADGPRQAQICSAWFAAHDTDLTRCRTTLDEAVQMGVTTCPRECAGLFQTMPPQCGKALKLSLPPEMYKEPRSGAQTFDVCETVLCKSGSCSITVSILQVVRPIFLLPNPDNPVWAELQGRPVTPPSASGDGELGVGAIVAIVVSVNVVVLTLVALLVVVRRRRRAARQQQQLQLVPGALPPLDGEGGSGKMAGYPSSTLASDAWALEHGGLDLSGHDLDTTEDGSDGSGGVKPGERRGTDIAASAVGAGALLAAPPPLFFQPSRQGSPSIPAGTVQRPSSPGGAGALAALWAGAAAAAADGAALPGDPLLAWLNHDQAAQQQQQQQQQEQRPGSRSERSSASGSPVQRGSTAPPGALGPPLASRLMSRRGSSAMVDLAPWEVKWRDLGILRPLGEGSFGKVYLASWNATLCALKVLLSADDAAAAARSDGSAVSLSSPVMQELQKECGMMASLRHPNVVLFLGVCYSPPAILTEYCSRGSLFDVLRAAAQSGSAAAALSWPRRLNMALDAAKGMLALHAHAPPIIHRDLKSPNLLVDAGWRVKVCDFNLSKLIEDTGARSSSIGGICNPRWLAPEVLTGGSASAASDVFSFAVVLWEMLTWRLPWDGKNAFQLVFMVSSGERLAFPAREELAGPAPAPEVYVAYTALMARCWAQAPEDRPSFADVIAELREILTMAVASRAEAAAAAAEAAAALAQD